MRDHKQSKARLAMATDGSDIPKPSRKSLVLSLVNVVVRSTRATAETVVGSVLAVANLGRYQKLPNLDNDILLRPATMLARQIRQGELSSEDVVKAYIQRISEVNSVVNAVVDGRYSEAMEEAKRADQLVRSGIKTQEELAAGLPLLGVPFTAKEAVVIQGLSSTCGLVCRKGLKAERDSEAAAALRATGAIPLAVTNTSEICMWWETYNNLHGQTNNPYDVTRTVGGSSGGEAALIASGGSILGLGTDLGGSIRLPAFFTGIFGHKPSQGLVPHGGQYPPALAEISSYVVTGPMTRYACDLKLALGALIGNSAAEQIKLHSKVDLQSIKVFYMLDDGGHPAQTPVASVIKERIKKVVDLLSEIGLSVEQIKVRNLQHGFIIWCSHLSRVKDQSITNLMSGGIKTYPTEPLNQELWKWFSGRSEHTLPIILNACAQDYLAPYLQKPLEFFINRGEALSQEMAEILKGNSVFLYPTFPTAATHHGQIIITPQNTGYSVAFNSLGLPVTQCPLGITDAGLPIGMQIVTGHCNDRLSIALAEEIEARLGGWVKPS